ncbi:MAG TPA: DUF3160 domain-containing protein [bacterium]|nr:DUF3160 domain-containing protein [bacterium]
MKRTLGLFILFFATYLIVSFQVCFAQIKPDIKPYRVSDDLKEVANLKDFSLSDETKNLLVKNLFVVMPAEHEQPFFVYEANDYRGIPSFVSVDSVLHVYHLFFDFTLRQLEEEKLMPLIEEFTRKLLIQTTQTYKKVQTRQLKEAALKNMAFCGVAARLLEFKVSLPEEATKMVETEINLIKNHAFLDVGAIFPYAIDYSQFVPRGHYTRTEALKKYFYVMMWYGLSPFSPRYRDSSSSLYWTPEVTRQAMLMTFDIYSGKLTQLWDKIYTPINFFVGFSDDIRPDEVKKLTDKIFGKNANLTSFTDKKKFENFMKSFVNLRMPEIKPKLYWIAGELPPLPDPETPQLRVLGQRYIPDSEILQELCDINRMIPKGLDVMAVLGSKRAEYLLDEFYKEPEKWKGYLPKRNELKERFSKLSEKQWTSNLYWNWLWVIKGLLKPFGDGYPSFMCSDAWQDKCLQTALSSWSQLRHDTILYAKQSFVAAECGGGDEDEEPPRPKGYVEPNIEAYQRLLNLAIQTRNLLEPRGLMSKQMSDKLKEFEDMLVFLKKISEKELQNIPLTSDEYDQIRLIGSTMDYLARWVIAGGKEREWNEIIHPSDRNMACIADVHTGYDSKQEGEGTVVLEEGVGNSFEIYVVVPIEGKLYLTRGPVFSYYEFTHPVNDRLTDEKWQMMLEEKKAPEQPEWIRFFTTKEGKKEIIIPQPRYSGC